MKKINISLFALFILASGTVHAEVVVGWEGLAAAANVPLGGASSAALILALLFMGTVIFPRIQNTYLKSILILTIGSSVLAVASQSSLVRQAWAYPEPNIYSISITTPSGEASFNEYNALGTITNTVAQSVKITKLAVPDTCELEADTTCTIGHVLQKDQSCQIRTNNCDCC